MTENVHPSSGELLAALHEPDRTISTLEHLDECLACRVRLSRIRRDSGFLVATADSLQRIVDASTLLPDALVDVVSGGHAVGPMANEIWRVGESEALLVWVRQVFEDDVADIIPMMLDVELADQESVVVGADVTPLATEMAVMVSLRTHVHTGAFLNRVGILDIGKDVAEVMTAAREGRRPSGVRVGPPIGDDDDQRLEYRQALRDLLAEFSPSAWLDAHDDPRTGAEQSTIKATASNMPGEIDEIKADLGERLRGLHCRDVHLHTVPVDEAVEATSRFKVVYLDTAVLVATLHGVELAGFPETSSIAAACQKLMLTEIDVDAVAVAIPQADWKTMLFTTANMRGAVELPGGGRMGPTATLEGHGLVETLFKHLEGALVAWEVTDQVSGFIERTDLREIASNHANRSIAKIVDEGKRARQAAKRDAWGNLPDQLEEQVAMFVLAIINRKSVDEALTELAPKASND